MAKVKRMSLSKQRMRDTKDAARYRWWRAQWAADTDAAMDLLNDTLARASTAEEIDAAIDSQREPQIEQQSTKEKS